MLKFYSDKEKFTRKIKFILFAHLFKKGYYGREKF